jgi:sialate O-acetylesterase
MFAHNIAFRIIIAIVFVCTSVFAGAAVRLPRILGDNMVLQRQKEVRVWGWANPGEKVKLSFNGQHVETVTGRSGTWSVTFKPMEHGGPFTMDITGKSNSIQLKNILIGDVWVGSGQSNMEWIMENTDDAEREIAVADFPMIRLFTVQKDMSARPKADLKGGEWQECNSTNVRHFSAVAYYFGKKLHRELDVPIGLINSSWGGTKVEPWISWEVMGREEEFRSLKLEALEKTIVQNERNQLRFAEAMKHDRGLAEKWFSNESKVTGWKPIKLPQEWSRTEIGNTDGIVWFRKEITLSSGDVADATLSLGPIDDIDYTYVNGTQVGSEGVYNKERVYPVGKALLKEGRNIIVVKVIDNQGGGGLYGTPEQLFLEVNGKRIPLDGAWEWKSSVLTSDFGITDVGPNAYPSQLYNAMIAPIVAYPIRGIIWYQGESNAGASYRYQTLFKALINDWRSKWGYEFPFFWAQLANFMKAPDQPGESGWAELREAQRMALALPKTGQAVILDIGEANDIHPRNKKDVGERLALNALAVEYGNNIVYSGPLYQSMEVKDNRAILTFTHTGSGLWSKGNRYGYLNSFAIAGEDRKFYWAKAFIEGDKVVVYHEKVARPVAVRYAWSDNPDDANLYNKEGLPASSFKTDSWEWVTDSRRNTAR